MNYTAKIKKMHHIEKNYQNVKYQSAKQSYQHNFTHTYVVLFLPNINFSFGNNINGDKNEQVV